MPDFTNSAPDAAPTDATTPAAEAMRLDLYDAGSFDRGRPRWLEAFYHELVASNAS